MDDEFRFHMEQRAADLQRAGLSPRAARRRAHHEFGSVERWKHETRVSLGVRLLDETRSDVRHALRALRRSPGFALGAVLTLALAVSANTAIFGVIDAALWRPLPFAEPDRLVALHQTMRPVRDAGVRRWSYPEFAALRASLTSIDHLAAYWPEDVNLSYDTETPVRVRAEIVSPAYLSALGVRPTIGRAFTPSEDSIPGAHPVVLLGHALWQTRFGGDAGVLGRSVHLNGVALTVVGVLPPAFVGLTGDAEVWFPHAMAPLVGYAGHLTTAQQFLSVIGRLAPGVALERAAAEVATVGTAAAVSARLASIDAQPGESEVEQGSVWSAAIVRLADARATRHGTRAYAALGAAVLFVLLIAAANLTALMLTRHVGRVRETTVRAALGAGRLRITRLVATEGVVIGVLGGAAGVLLGIATAGLLVPFIHGAAARSPYGAADIADFAVPTWNARVLAFGFAAASLTALVAALMPMAARARADLASALRIGPRGSSAAFGSLRRPTLLSATVLAQVAGAFVLLVGAGLLLGAFRQLSRVDAGIDPTNVITARLSAPEQRYGGEAAAALLESVLERVHALPGVEAASVAFCTPYMRCSSSPLYHAGSPATGSAPIVGRHYVGPDHFRALGIPLIAGRALDAGDRAGRARVAVVSESAARRLWPGESPVGRRVWFGSGGGFASPDSLTEIVGVVGDVAYGGVVTADGFAGDRVDVYTSYLQFTWPTAYLIVRSAAEPGVLVPALRQAVADVDAGLPLYDVRSLQSRASEVVAAERYATNAVATFAALGLLLAAVGVYGVMAHSVAQRRRELGIRVALGASPGAVLRLVARQAVVLAAAGLLVGAIAVVPLAGSLGALVPGAGTVRPAVLAATGALLLLSALLAAALPARTAARVDPLETLAGD